MNATHLTVMGTLLWMGCASSPPAEATRPATTGSAVVASEKTSARTCSVETPASWKQQHGAGFDTFTGPDPRLKIHLIETRGEDAEKAIRAAWLSASPAMKLPEKRRQSPAPEQRFEEQLVITYVDAKEESFAQAVAMRVAQDDRIIVFLVEGPLKEARKRGAEVMQVMSSLKIDGVEELKMKAADVKSFDAARRAAFFASVEEARAQVGITGVAVGVVTPEGTFAKGFGERSIDGHEPVDADTQFMIGSVSKSFSTLLVAKLVDEGKLSWDAKAKDVYARFEVADPERTKRIEMQHLFCACTGAPRQDMELLFDFADTVPSDVFAEVAQMKLTTDFGETFQYNNQLTGVGGFIAGHVAFPKEKDLHRAYVDALRSRVWEPLGMASSMIDPDAVTKRGNYAMPHRLDWSGKTLSAPLSLERFATVIAPAGGIWSTANDMARYIQLQLGKGEVDGERIVSAASLKHTQTPQIKVTDHVGYGMGWLIGEYRGLKVVEHSGGTIGFNTDLVIFPEIGVGLFIVANRSPAGILNATRERLTELLFDLPPRALADLERNHAEMLKILAEMRAKISPVPVPSELLGKYASRRLGAAELRAEGSDVMLDVGEWKATVGVYDPKEEPNTLVLTSGPLQGTKLRIEDGKLVLKHSQSDYVFTKR